MPMMTPFSPPPDSFEAVSTREGYNRWAEIYDNEDNPLIALEEPHVARLLGDVRGLTVADIGCGTGRHALTIAAAGASVTAVDFSEEMLDRARRKPGAEAIRFAAHDVHGRLPFGDRSFDRVLSALVGEHITDLSGWFAEMGRICKREGAIVVSLMHPAMTLRGIQARFVDPATGRETRPHSWPHQISDFVMGALSAGLRIEQIGEHRVDEALAAKSPRAQKYLGWPMLLTMRLRPESG